MEVHLDSDAADKHATAAAHESSSPNGQPKETSVYSFDDSAGGIVTVEDLGPETEGKLEASPDNDMAGGKGALADESDYERPTSPTGEAGKLQQADPFKTLKHAELEAIRIAQALAPRHIRRPGEFRRAFGFPGHRRIFSEINLLCEARQVVKKILMRSPEVLENCHRAMLWLLRVSKLNTWIANIGGLC